MAKATSENKAGHITHGDVLADLGFSDEEIRETEIKMTIWRPLRAEIESRALTQARLAELLEVHQPDASLLVRGRLAKFSVTKLMQFAERLGLHVRVTVKPTIRHTRTVRSRASATAVKRTQRVRAAARAKAVG